MEEEKKSKWELSVPILLAIAKWCAIFAFSLEGIDILLQLPLILSQGYITVNLGSLALMLPGFLIFLSKFIKEDETEDEALDNISDTSISG